MNINNQNIIKFIKESNKIENVEEKKEIEQSYISFKYLLQKKTLSLENILEAHRILYQNFPNASKIGGQLRQCNIIVSFSQCTSWHKVPALLQKWLKKYANEAQDPKKAHIEFEKIHPFEDANGRIGRLIWLWHREKAQLPFLYIRYKDRFEYYKWFYKRGEIELIGRYN